MTLRKKLRGRISTNLRRSIVAHRSQRYPLQAATALSMFSLRILLVTFVLLAAIFPVYSRDPHNDNARLRPIKSPPSQCQPFIFHWTGGTPPFFVLLHQNGVLQRSLGPTNDSSLPWDSDFPAGTVLDAAVSDSGDSSPEGAETFTLQAGPSSVCLGLPPSTGSSSESTAAVSLTDPTSPLGPSSSPSPSHSPHSISAALTPSSGPKPGTTVLLPTDSKTLSISPSYMSRQPMAPHSGTPSVPGSSASNPDIPQESASREHSNGGRVAGIVIGCLLATALVAAIALVVLRKRRRARMRSRIASMRTLDTLAFTGTSPVSRSRRASSLSFLMVYSATTWSDLSPPEPDKPFGANKGVREWNADLFARERDSSRKRLSLGVPLTTSIPHVPSKRAQVARVAPPSMVPEAGVLMPSSDSTDDSTSGVPSLRSYPPLVPQTLSARGDPFPKQHAYPPAILPPAQVPVNPFRARLLAAATVSNGTWARSDGSGAGDSFR